MNSRKIRTWRGLWRRAVALSVVLAALPAAAWALTICGRCGYEGKQGARFCSHCGAPLEVAADAVAASRPVETADAEAETAETAASSPIIVSETVPEMRRPRTADLLAL